MAQCSNSMLRMLMNQSVNGGISQHQCVINQTQNLMQGYACPGCGGSYSSMDAARLLDPATGEFHCEDCKYGLLYFCYLAAAISIPMPF